MRASLPQDQPSVFSSAAAWPSARRAASVAAPAGFAVRAVAARAQSVERRVAAASPAGSARPVVAALAAGFVRAVAIHFAFAAYSAAAADAAGWRGAARAAR